LRLRRRREHDVATLRRELMRDDVPGLARALAEGHIDVAALQRAERDDVDLGAGLEDDDRLLEEGQRGVRVRERAHAVALTDDLTGRRERVRATRAPVFDVALEDRELSTRGEAARCRREQDAETGHEE